MPVGVKTPPEVASQIVALAREGKSRREVVAETSVSLQAVSRIVREAGVVWGRINSGANGTAEAMAKARGVQSDYARNRRAQLSERTLDEYERTLDLMKLEMRPRERSLLSQALRHQSGAYADLTQADLKGLFAVEGVVGVSAPSAG